MRKEWQILIGVILIFLGMIVLLVLGDSIGLINDSTMILRFFFVIVFTILFILIVREIVMWYWKINRIVDQLDEQNETLKEILKSFNTIGKV